MLTSVNQLWIADLTYIRLLEEFVFLAAILDAFSRRVIGWTLDRYLDDELTLTALRMALDRRLPSPGLVHHSDRGSQYASRDYTALLAYLEIVYMGCFLLVPAGFGVLALAGRSDLADRYWTIVAAAEFGAFAPLTIVQTRPPWLVERKAVLADRGIHRAASQMIERFTIHANTLPSGHVAGSLAVGFALLDPLPWVSGAALLLSLSIAVATVVGRYHYVVDGIAGTLLALAVWAIVRLAGV